MGRRSMIIKKIKDEHVDNEEIFEVEAILDKRIVSKQVRLTKSKHPFADQTIT